MTANFAFVTAVKNSDEKTISCLIVLFDILFDNIKKMFIEDFIAKSNLQTIFQEVRSFCHLFKVALIDRIVQLLLF